MERSAPIRQLTFPALLALGLNGIVGVGIFFIPDDIAALVPGVGGAAVYLATALALLPIAGVYAVLGGRFAEDGGPYLWARAAFGSAAAFGVGWTAYVSAVFSSAAVICGLSEPIARALGLSSIFGERFIALLCIAALASVAFGGLRISAATWSALTLAKLIPLAVLAAFGGWGLLAHPAALGATPEPSPASYLRAMLIAVFALQGFEIVAVPAGHARVAAWAVPGATLGALLGAAALYGLLHGACAVALPDLAHASQPLVAAAAALAGGFVAKLVAMGTSVSALGIAFGMLAMTPRYLAALGRPAAFGAWLGTEDPRGVPRRALTLTAGVIGALVFAALGAGAGEGLRKLFLLSSILVLAQYAVSTAALAALALRRRAHLGLQHLSIAALSVIPLLALAQAVTIGELGVAMGVLASGFAALWLQRAVSMQRRSGFVQFKRNRLEGLALARRERLEHLDGG
jgi:APA family basic amino acid/polyamine antiporter